MTSTHRYLHRTLLALIASGSAVFSSQSFGQYSAAAYAGSEYPFAGTTTPGDATYTYNGTGAVGTSSSATVSFTANPVASISVATSVDNPFGQTIISGAGIMTYSFEVASAPLSVVPIDFSGLYSSYVYSSQAGTNTGSSTTRFLIQTVNSTAFTYASFNSYFYGNCGAPSCLQYGNTTLNNTSYTTTRYDALHAAGSFQGTLDMLTGADGKVTGQVQLFAGGGGSAISGTSNASTFIDPHLEIDGAFLAVHPGATLTITPGVGNAVTVAAVPEASTFALMLVGLATLGVSRRRARRAG